MFQPELYKGVIYGKSLLLVSQKPFQVIPQYFAGCNMLKCLGRYKFDVETSPLYLSRQLEHVVPGKNIEAFPDKRLMTNQQRSMPFLYMIKVRSLIRECVVRMSPKHT